ncbi:MAG: PQQ-binding-like beta-propeller repeat protein [Bryobacterales bacterium]|nr:PQQ-binding-like beta-propeller repeat protein [Bryobacterales bacterium]
MRSVLGFAIPVLFAAGHGLAQSPAQSPLYSPLKQIHGGNAAKLVKAWQYDSRDEFKGSEIQCRPLVIEGVLYATTPKLRVVALDGATGKELWSFDPFFGKPVTSKQRSRGFMHWNGRLYFGAGHMLFALDRKTGKLADEFGDHGRVDLRRGLGRDPETQRLQMTSPGVVYNGLLIVGFLTSEALPSSPGDIRAYDARTGQLRWSFHTIPHPGEPGYETWPADGWKTLGGANSWPGLTLDDKRGLVFVPTGSAAFDFYGGNRPGDNLYANSLIALNAATGKRVWHFQFVKHDVWDRDLPTAPVLVTVKRGGRDIDAVAQCTKSGHVFVFNRETGESLFPLKTVAVPPSPAEGEQLAPTQVLPVRPEPFARQQLTEAMLTNRTPEAHASALKRFRTYRSGPQFTPPSFEGTVIFPGFDGGAEWGGQAYDPETGLLYINSNEMAWILRLVPQAGGEGKSTASRLYSRHCATCHREDRKGTPPEFPSLLNLEGKNVEEVIRKGAGRMPGFSFLGDAGVRALTAYLRTGGDKEVELPSPRASREVRLKYRTDGYNKFLDEDGYPAIAPPWGTLNALNVSTGEYAWRIPFGEFPELAAKGMKNTGTENYGGAVVTAGGLLFIGATNHDRKFHVYDKRSGKLLWETLLPAGGNATPVVYEVRGKQYVAIAAGGGKSGAPAGGAYVAFALP